MSKSDRTRQFIIEKTAPIFNAKGFAGTSMHDITEATGLTKGCIYGHFAGKDDVALAAFDHNYGLISSTIMRKVADKPHAADKLKVYLSVFGNFHNTAFLQGGCPVLNTAIEADDTHVQLRARAVKAIEAWQAHIENVIMHGKNNGQIQLGTNAKDFSSAFIAMLEGGMMLAKVTGKMTGMKAAIKHGEKMIKDITV